MKKITLFDALYKNAGYIAVVLISLVYIGGSFILISKTGKSVGEIIATGVISMLVGLLINGVFRSIGINKGESDERTIKTAQLYSKSIEEISPYVDKLEDFCEMENKRAISSLRRKILATAGLHYNDFFDSEGILCSSSYELYSDEEIKGAKGRKKRKMIFENFKRKRAYDKASNLKIKHLTPSALTCDGVKENNPFDFGKSKREYAREKNLSDALSRVVMAVIFGINVLLNRTILNTLQIVMYITSGIIQMYSSFSWVVDEHRGGIIKKIDYLQKFKVYVTNHRLAS